MQIPRVELVEMGPSMNLALRRLRPAGQDMEHEAMARPKAIKKKVGLPFNNLSIVAALVTVFRAWACEAAWQALLRMEQNYLADQGVVVSCDRIGQK